MAKEFSEKFYNSKAWHQCRAGYIALRYGLCERCACKPGDIVHHKVLLTPMNINDPNTALNWSNLELLCIDCHNKEHHSSGDSISDGLRFDDNGNIIQTN